MAKKIMKQIVKILILTFLLTNSSFAQLSKVQIEIGAKKLIAEIAETCLLYTSPSPRDRTRSRMPSSA